VRVGGWDVPGYLLHNPLLETLQLGATIRRVADSKQRKYDTEPQGIGPGLLAGALGLSEEVPFIREQVEVAKAFDPRERAAFFGELGKSIAVPQLAQWLAQRLDTGTNGVFGEPVARKPVGTVQHLQMGIPWLRNQIPMNDPILNHIMQSRKVGYMNSPDREALRQSLSRSLETNAVPRR